MDMVELAGNGIRLYFPNTNQKRMNYLNPLLCKLDTS